MLSTTAGTYQAIYGRKVWSQLNQEFNAFSILLRDHGKEVVGELLLTDHHLLLVAV